MNKCKYCGILENKQYSPCLECIVCHNHVHLNCLLSKEPPGNFPGDVFFIFTCADCSENEEEIFDRGKMSWFNCLVLVLHDLSSKCIAISNQGYFHWRTHIGSFVNRNWHLLFHPHFKRRKNWPGTVSGILSSFSPTFFQSGLSVLNEQGWWKLSHGFSPALIKYLNSEIMVKKQKERPNKSQNTYFNDKDFEATVLRQLVLEMGYTDLLSKNQHKVEKLSMLEKNDVTDEIPRKKQKLDPGTQFSSIKDNSFSINSTFKNESYLGNYFLEGDESLSDFDGFLPDFEELSEASSGILLQNDLLNTEDYFCNNPSSGENGDSDYVINSPHSQLRTGCSTFSEESNEDHPNQLTRNWNTTIENVPPPIVRGLFNIDKNEKDTDLPWNKNTLFNNTKRESLIPVTEYEETKMLNHLNNICRKAQYEDIDKKMIRLRAKLSVRKSKRSKHRVIWNLDRLVCKLANFPVQDVLSQYTQQYIRVLDRFQHVTDTLSGSIMPCQVDFATRLAGSAEVNTFLSPYSGRLLKPYIRRDIETKPLWLKLMDELRRKVNKDVTIQYEAAPLDYCYVRPQHIAPINSLCAQYFWPGIDLTEALQYPDFSCVVLYKKLVVAFAFLVPDVGSNESYISFIFTRPEWRKFGIANFMLYHLIQTCIGKDITLHVSPTNSAVFLYQKFGFKTEELIQEFYEKYFPADSTDCKHALFLRLCR